MGQCPKCWPQAITSLPKLSFSNLQVSVIHTSYFRVCRCRMSEAVPPLYLEKRHSVPKSPYYVQFS